MIKNWIILASGFTQGPHEPNGMERIWRELRSKSSPKTSILYKTWDDDGRGLAEFVYRNSDPLPNILCVAYSWGVGHFTMDFFRGLREVGLSVDTFVSNDGVYHSNFVPFRWLALTRIPWLTIPSNVHRVIPFMQRENRPRGHRLIPEHDNLPEIEDPVYLPIPHGEMHKADEFIRTVREEVNSMLSGGGGYFPMSSTDIRRM